MAVASSRPDYAMDNMMRSYANSGRGWTGGDGGESVALAGGRTAWLFDDSYLGKVVRGARPESVFLHNMVVVQDQNSLTTRYRTWDRTPLELMNRGIPLGSKRFYWSDDGIQADGSLWVTYSKYYYPGKPTVFGFVRLGEVLVRYSLRTMRTESITRVPDAARVIWGTWMTYHGPYVYIYGAETAKDGLSTDVYLARAHLSDLVSPWQYWDGSEWSSDASLAAVISNSAGGQFSVTKVGNVYVLVTMGTGFLNRRVWVSFSCRPMGPFTNRKLAYTTTGRGGVYGTNGIPGLYTYGVTVHPELSQGDQLVISYDVNTSDWALLNENVNIVRPRYARINISTSAAAVLTT